MKWKKRKSVNLNGILLLLIVLIGVSMEIKRGRRKLNHNKPSNRVNNSPKTKIIMEKNDKINITSKDEFTKYTTYSPCTHKTGFLGLVKDVKDPQLNINSPSQIFAMPIFVDLNTKTLSFFSSTETKSLFHSVYLDKISQITQKFKNTFCFDIIEYEAPILNDLAVKKCSTTLCASSLEEMKNWVESFEEFKTCQFQSVIPENKSKKILVDFDKVNLLLSHQGNRSKSKLPISKEDYYYNNDNNLSPLSLSPEKIAQEMKLKEELNSLREIMRKSNMEEKKVKRSMLEELDNAEKFALEVHRKQEKVKEEIKKEMMVNSKKEAELMSIGEKEKELELVKEMKEKIKKLKMAELEDYRKAVLEKIEQFKNKASEEAKEITQTLLDQEKNNDYSECVDKRVIQFKDKEYISEICLKYYGEAGLHSCEEKKDFCDKCCSHHVGIKHGKDLFACKTQCNKLTIGL